MFKTDYGKFKYLGLLAALSITFGVTTSFAKARLMTLFGVDIPASTYLFPAVYLISDILTEVYGYAQARSVIWMTILCRVIAACAVCIILQFPPAPDFKNEAAYQLVLSASMRMSLVAVIAMFAGDVCNNYILAKLKIWNKGKHLWFRFIASTIIGESINSVFAITLAFYDVLTVTQIIEAIVVGTFAKSAWEIIALPVTYPIVRYLKKVEKTDYYDRDTDFNPFITDAGP
jgi:queuosine precursor transporter